MSKITKESLEVLMTMLYNRSELKGSIPEIRNLLQDYKKTVSEDQWNTNVADILGQLKEFQIL